MLTQTNLRMAKEVGEPHRVPACEERGARPREDTSQEARVCQMAEAIQDTYGCLDRKSTAKAPDRLCLWMMHSAVAKIKRVAGAFRKEREGILNWWKKGSTNSFLEGLSSLVQSAESAARGFRNIVNNKTMVFLRLGKMDFSAQKQLACATH